MSIIDQTIYDMSADDLAKEVVGKTVTNVDTEAGVITLNDGTTLQIEDTQDCCAWFEGKLKAGNLMDNAVNAVTFTKRDGDKWTQHYTLHIIAANIEVCAIEIDGDETSGYYCQSINLKVKREVAV